MGSDDTVERVVARLRSRGPTPSVLHDADRLLRRAEPVVRRVVGALVRSGAGRAVPADQVEDLVQQTLEVAWRKLPDFDTSQTAAFEAWVRGIARFVFANARRKRVETLTEDGVVDPSAPAHSVLASLHREERDALVTDAIAASLAGIEQDVLYHRYIHDLDREHIAELLDLADANAVRVVLQRAQRKLRSELERRLAELGHGRSFVRTVDG